MSTYRLAKSPWHGLLQKRWVGQIKISLVKEISSFGRFWEREKGSWNGKVMVVIRAGRMSCVLKLWGSRNYEKADVTMRGVGERTYKVWRMGKMQLWTQGKAVGEVQPIAGITGRDFKSDHEIHPSVICFHYHHTLANLNNVSKETLCWSNSKLLLWCLLSFFN